MQELLNNEIVHAAMYYQFIIFISILVVDSVINLFSKLYELAATIFNKDKV